LRVITRVDRRTQTGPQNPCVLGFELYLDCFSNTDMLRDDMVPRIQVSFGQPDEDVRCSWSQSVLDAGAFCHRRGGGEDFRGRKGRVFDGGEVKLVILALVAEKSRHGYEIIKDLSRRVGIEYSPSPGIVYPTLTLLKKMNYASVREDHAGRKLYTITPEGKKFLAENKAGVDAIFARFGDSDRQWIGRFSTVIRGMLNLQATVRLRLANRPATQEQIQVIVDALDAAAKAVERI
jgi:DNA-binding PadR family transcriptional regulator